MPAPLRVGIVGAAATRTGWAAEAHVPAVAAIDGLELAAVATRTRDSAEEAARAFGTPSAHAGARALAEDPDVDVVVVAAPVPGHAEAVRAALAAGKHVYSEWPLGVDDAETERLADEAAAGEAHDAIGLQAASSPAVVGAAELIAGGAIGRPLSASALSTTAGFGRRVPAGAVALEDPGTGMHLLTIQAAHTVDVVQRVLGPLASLSATLSTRFEELSVEGREQRIARTLPDHVLLQGRTGDATPVDVQVVGGTPADASPFRLDVAGTEGTLSLVGGAPRGFQAGRLRLLVDGRERPDDRALAHLPDSVVNVASAYRRLRDDVLHGTRSSPSFADALELTRLIAAVRTSDADGRRVRLDAIAGTPASER